MGRRHLSTLTYSTSSPVAPPRWGLSHCSFLVWESELWNYEYEYDYKNQLAKTWNSKYVYFAIVYKYFTKLSCLLFDKIITRNLFFFWRFRMNSKIFKMFFVQSSYVTKILGKEISGATTTRLPPLRGGAAFWKLGQKLTSSSLI